jgi:hypothetical protein
MEFESDDQLIICPECNVPYHAECWQENNGCAVYGCNSGDQVSANYDYTTTTNTPSQNTDEHGNIGCLEQIGEYIAYLVGCFILGVAIAVIRKWLNL